MQYTVSNVNTPGIYFSPLSFLENKKYLWHYRDVCVSGPLQILKKKMMDFNETWYEF